jgi:hypothetical protein
MYPACQTSKLYTNFPFSHILAFADSIVGNILFCQSEETVLIIYTLSHDTVSYQLLKLGCWHAIGSCVSEVVNPVIKFLPHTLHVCGRNLITGLTSATSPRVDISSTCTVGQKLGVSLPLLTCFPLAWPSHYCTTEVGNPRGTYELPCITPHVCIKLTKFVHQILSWESIVIHLVKKLLASCETWMSIFVFTRVGPVCTKIL